MSNFFGGQATQSAQGQGNLRIIGQRRVTAGEDEFEPLIGVLFRLDLNFGIN